MLSQYFFEIKNRFMLVFLSWSITFTIAYLNKNILLFLCIKPILYLFEKNSFYFIATSLTDIFSTYLDLSYLISFQLTFYFILYQVRMFMRPSLYRSEVKQLNFFIYLSFILWLISLSILNLAIIPSVWYFFASFQNFSTNQLNIFLEVRITEYLSFYILLYWIVVVICLIFLVLSIFLNIFSEKLLWIKTTRKPFYFFFLSAATLLTPPDVISQLIVGFSFVIAYELLIVIHIMRIINFFRQVTN